MERNISIYELTLGRVLDYLTHCGVEPTPTVVHRALRIIEDALQHGEENLLPRVFSNLSKHIDLPEAPVPYPVPPINRRSMGYGQI